MNFKTCIHCHLLGENIIPYWTFHNDLLFQVSMIFLCTPFFSAYLMNSLKTKYGLNFSWLISISRCFTSFNQFLKFPRYSFCDENLRQSHIQRRKMSFWILQKLSLNYQQENMSQLLIRSVKIQDLLILV